MMLDTKKSDWIDFEDHLDRNEDCIKMAILPFGALFEVLPRAKKSKLGKSKNYTSRTIPNDARNTKKSDWIDFGDRLDWKTDRQTDGTDSNTLYGVPRGKIRNSWFSSTEAKCIIWIQNASNLGAVVNQPETEFLEAKWAFLF